MNTTRTMELNVRVFDVLPSQLNWRIKDFHNYVQVNDDIFFTDCEEVAIAIIDSLQTNGLVIFWDGVNDYSVYSEKYLGEGGSLFVKSCVLAFLNR